MGVTIGIVKETTENETRVALVPEVTAKLGAMQAEVLVETGAGTAAGIPDELYKDASIEPDARALIERCDILFKVQPPTEAEVAALKPGSIVVGFMQPHRQHAMLQQLCDKQITSFAVELVPRISRAQSMDALSSQAAVAGYKAVLLAAGALPKFVPMLTTAAGTIRPSSFLIMGAGVAGLQAIATARRLGGVVEAFDVRSATREQVESLGAKFVDTGVSAEGEGGYARELTDEEKAKQQEVLADHIARTDVVITTAAVPGKPAPRLISAADVEAMRPGSVIVDLGAESGGNCELTEAGSTVVRHGVTIIGPVNLPSTLPRHASEMYARNLLNLMSPALHVDEGDNAGETEIRIDWDDEVFAGAVLTRDGEIIHEPTRAALAKGAA